MKPAASKGVPLAEALSPVWAARDFNARMDDAADEAPGRAATTAPGSVLQQLQERGERAGEIVLKSSPRARFGRSLSGNSYGSSGSSAAVSVARDDGEGAAGDRRDGGGLAGALRGHRARIRRLEKENEALRSTLSSPIVKGPTAYRSADAAPSPAKPLGSLSPALGLGMQHASLRNPYRR